MMEDESSIRVSFTTSYSQYRVTDIPFAVPLRLTRYGLSEVINHLLSNTKKEDIVPFDFLVNSPPASSLFLRSSLDMHIRKHGLSTEEVVHIEYMPLIEKPELESEKTEPDWISSVYGRGSVYVTGSYDGSVRLYTSLKGGCELVSTFHTHTQPIKGITLLHKNDEGDMQIVTASKDNTLLVQSVSLSTCTHSIDYKCMGHDDSVECVSVSPDGRRFVSGDWTGHALVWSLPPLHSKEGEEEEEERHKSKKRKIEGGSPHTDLREGQVDQMFNATSQCVSSVIWTQPTSILTGSWDHCIRTWDVETGGLTHTLHGKKVVTSLAAPPSSSSSWLVASGHPDERVRVWDTRTSGNAVVKLTLSSHTGWVSSVSWSPLSLHMLASCSYDGSVKVWDIRSQVPLFTLAGHTDKVLDVDWSEDGKKLISGGADTQLRIHSLNM